MKLTPVNFREKFDRFNVNGNDTDNIDNWNCDGDRVGGWTFVGVIDPAGFTSAEILELSGKDFQQEYLFGDGFSISVFNQRRSSLWPVVGPVTAGCRNK